jgi:ABC-type protease/lipase transport system fused ATPase/permease subunit
MILRLPRGYDTTIGEDGVMLSGGQKQRIALALALFGTPKVLVLDEPNSNLDADGETALLRALAVLRENGTTVVLITHKLNLINAAEKILVMRDGAVEMLGPRAAVLQRLGAVGQPVAVTGFKASVAGE